MVIDTIFFIILLANIILVWENNPLENLVNKKVIEKRKYLEESNPDNEIS